MREIKFRGWSESIRKMTYFGTGDAVITSTELKDGEAWGMFFKALGPVYLTGYQAVMMYTGYKDINGKEIWEGDIIDFRRGERKLYIAFNSGQWNMCGNIEDPDADYRNLDHYIQHDGPIEVIGNIYEDGGPL